jgi:hypothetical protein
MVDAYQRLLLDDDEPDEDTPNTWQNHGPFQIWAAPQGMGIVYVGSISHALVRFNDGVVFHEGPGPTGELMSWVERVLREGKRSAWDVLKEPDPEDSVAPPVLVQAEKPAPRDEPVQRGSQLKTLRLPGDNG